MVKVHNMNRRGGGEPLEAVLEQTAFETPGAEDRPKAKEHGFAVLFAACVELQQVLIATQTWSMRCTRAGDAAAGVPRRATRGSDCDSCLPPLFVLSSC